MQIAISNLKQDVTRSYPCRMRRASLMNILEHPALFSIEIEAHKGGADCVPARNVRAFRVPESGVARLQFVQQFLHSRLKFVVRTTLEDLLPPG
jgi:hypothetical protein